MTPLPENLDQLKAQGLSDLDAAETLEALEAVRLKYLARKDGRITKVFESLPQLSPDQKKDVGRLANEIKRAFEDGLAVKKRGLESVRMNADISKGAVDLTLPGASSFQGGLHPITQVMEEITGVFLRLGFNVAEGPEAEDDEHNFTALNHPPEHPARDAHDTFYLKNLKDAAGRPLLLRTHTSPVQIRYMKTHKPPLYIVAPGRVYRHENVDATHSYVFHQVEGLAVDKDLSLADLKGVLSLMAREIFGSSAEIRFRPSYFPFVEPGIEVDVSCTLCAGKGCRVCKNSGWVEMLGAGLVHPNVFRAVGHDPAKVTGYAFGIGVERVAMFKYGVGDIRHFIENDIRFLGSFS